MVQCKSCGPLYQGPDVALAIWSLASHDGTHMKAAITIFVLLALGLGAGLILQHKKAVKEMDDKNAEIAKLNQTLESTRAKLDDQEKISFLLRNNLDEATNVLKAVSNSLDQVNAKLQQTESEYQASVEAAQKAEEEAKKTLAEKEGRINELSAQGNELNTKISGLETAMTSLNTQISDTEAQLAAAEGDREFLLKELKRLQTEKAELERQFNDLSILRTQVAKLKEELSISRRLEWIRMGLYGSATTKKGAELLMSGIKPVRPRSNYNLNVELRQDGETKVLTNAPPNNE